MAEKEYIDKLALLQFLIDEIKQCEDDYGDDYEEDDYYTQAVDSRMTAMLYVKRRVELTPAADVVEVRRGKWIVSVEQKTNLLKSSIRREKKYGCPYCGIVYRKYMNFCGNCGARLNEGENNG